MKTLSLCFSLCVCAESPEWSGNFWWEPGSHQHLALPDPNPPRWGWAARPDREGKSGQGKGETVVPVWERKQALWIKGERPQGVDPYTQYTEDFEVASLTLCMASLQSYSLIQITV